MSRMGYRLLDTALGTMGIGWTGLGLVRLLLPGEGPTIMRERLAGRCGEELQNGMADLTRRVRAYAEGARDDFADIELDLSGIPGFSRRIYGYTRALGWGETTTYGAIARWLGDVALSRAVSTAMGANHTPHRPLPPCARCRWPHRRLLLAGRRPHQDAAAGARAPPPPNGQFSFGF
ncbi:MAG: methylated-DNA--[protein]-cysteine S-methyltransferase [Devosia sp.]|nr:methylated-DNA--[protein]-cysteine S-methyltransferase [Devosia sp.]